MSETKVNTEIVLQEQCIKDTRLIDDVDIIDVSSCDLNDTDNWLYTSTGCETEPSIYNLYTWLKSEPESIISGNRRAIDTRTFTRPKKRLSRTNFESVFETVPSNATDTWKTEYSDCSNLEEDLSKYSDMPILNKGQSVPPMLKIASTANINDGSIAVSGGESMEIFLNASDSKGIDSFINLWESGINESLMKVSQPSIFYSSFTSLSSDEPLHNVDCDKEEEHTNLTHLCSEQDNQHKDLNSSKIDETFSITETDNNKSYCLNLINKTYINESCANEKVKLNETYNSEEIPKTSSLAKDKCDTSTLSSTFVYKSDGSIELPHPRNSEKKETYNLDTTYLSTSQSAKHSLGLDATYCAAEIEIVNKDVPSADKTDIYKDKNEACDVEKNTVFNIPKDLSEKKPEISGEDSFIHSNALDSTFKLPIPLCNQSTPKNADALNFTFDTINKHFDQFRMHNAAISSNLKAPTSLRRELLAEIHRSGDHKLNCTFDRASEYLHDGDKAKEKIVNEIVRNDIPVENKYNTYKKESSINRLKSQAEIVNEVSACVQNSPDRKYYTFTKKSGTHGGKTDIENAESTEHVDTTFVKPLPKSQKRRQHIPRMFSKLPQFLQKSNPNLVSNPLKTVSGIECTNASSIRYMKGSQPNIVSDVEKSLTNKLYTLGKVKSGSEQRLLELNTGVGELQTMGAGGSTESIESTQSAHSAPDLDDRLSTCSDCSHNSYTVQPMNIEQLHQIVRMQEESLKQDAAPQLSKRVLDNTWIDKKRNLSSPILKNGTDAFEIDSSSPQSIDDAVKTSSPILSPTRSSQSINTDGHSTENPSKQQNDMDTEEKVEMPNKPMIKIENKTRLRQPTNWNTGNRASNLISAIPRPSSRIPAPRFVRPIVKNSQGEIKKGYM
ncbi:uncharacterized protein LOC143177432 [Calliopsis andreniformis]|uniref:uncharacterized protein LOC143177432 n=1 Tax=Calliopsis andreniformis TaxID=337506 RepID=UPI003FCD2633